MKRWFTPAIIAIAVIVVWYSASIALLYVPYRDWFQAEVNHHDLGFRIVARPLP